MATVGIPTNYVNIPGTAMSVPPALYNAAYGNQNSGIANTFSSLLSQDQSAQTAANADNNARYQQALALYQGQQSSDNANLATLGQSETTQINQAAAQQQAQAQQSAIDRGLGNTTVVDSLNRGIAQSQQQNLQALAEQVNQAKISTGQTDTGNIANTIINKTTTAPSYSDIANLAAQYGQAQQAGTNNQLAAQLLIGGGLSSANTSLQAYIQQLQNNAILGGQPGISVNGQAITGGVANPYGLG